MAARTKGETPSTQSRLAAPETLGKDVAAIFSHIVSSVEPEHFSAVDLPLLEAYAHAAHLSATASTELDRTGAIVDGKASPWLVVQEKAGKQLVALSARLRICPQSRFDRLVAGANSRKRLSQPTGKGEPDPLDEFTVAGA